MPSIYILEYFCCSDDVDDPSRRESASPAATPEHESDLTSSDKTSNTDSIMLLSDDSTKARSSARKRAPPVRSLSPTPIKAKIPRTESGRHNSRENDQSVNKTKENILTLDDLTPSSSSSRRDSLEIIAPSPQLSVVKSQKRGRKSNDKSLDTNGKRDKQAQIQKNELIDKKASSERDKNEEAISSSNSVISPSGKTRSRASLSNLIPSSSDASNASSGDVNNSEPGAEKRSSQQKDEESSNKTVSQKDAEVQNDTEKQKSVPHMEPKTPNVDRVSPSSKSPEDMFVDAITSFDDEFVDAEEVLDDGVSSEASGPVVRQHTPREHNSRASPKITKALVNHSEENQQSYSTRSRKGSTPEKEVVKVTPARLKGIQNDASPMLSTRRSTRLTPKASPKITPKNVDFRKFSPLGLAKPGIKESPQVTRLRSNKLVESSDEEMFTDDDKSLTPKEMPQVRRLRKRNHIDSSDESGTDDSQDSPRCSARKLKKSAHIEGSGSDGKESPLTRKKNQEKQDSSTDQSIAGVSPSPMRQRRQKLAEGSPQVVASPVAKTLGTEKVVTSSPASGTRQKEPQELPVGVSSKEKSNDQDKLSKNMESPIIVQKVDKEITLSFKSPTPEHVKFINNSTDVTPTSKPLTEIQEEKIRSSPRLRNVVTDYKAVSEGKKNLPQEKTPSTPIIVLGEKIRQSPRLNKVMSDTKLTPNRPSRLVEKSPNKRKSTSSGDELSPTRLSPRLVAKQESPRSPPRKRFSEVEELRMHTSPGARLGRWTKPGPILYKIPPEVSRVVDEGDLQSPIMTKQPQEGLLGKETDVGDLDDTSDTPTRRSTRNTPQPGSSSASKAKGQTHR